MIPDIRFEADVLRAALLIGLVREREVHAWADALLTTTTDSVGLLADVALARPELTALREALRPVSEPSEPAPRAAGVLAFLATDPRTAALATPERIRLLAHLRREGLLAPALAPAIKLFEDRLMLASAGIGSDSSIADDLDRWLAAARGTTYFRFSIDHEDERAALLAALSRKVVRDRRSTDHVGCRAWLVDSGSSAPPALVLNEPLWRIAVAEFSPLPIGSRIPYAAVPAHALSILDEGTAEPMSASEAGDRLATS
jgi:hypothetical protein